jgi:hypothetical protein
MRAFAVIAVAILLAGCASNEPPAEPGTPTSSSTTTGPVPPPPPPAVHVGGCTDAASFSLSAAGVGAQDGASCPFAAAFEGDLTTLQGAVVELVWVPAQPTMMGAVVYVTSESCFRGMRLSTGGPELGQCDHGVAQGGAAPLRLELGPGVLADFGDDGLMANAAPDGATAGQEFTFYVSLFEGPIPPCYTAIPV